jgi:putative addiction module antidote
MSRELKITKVGKSLGIVLPTKLLTHLAVGEGDTLYAPTEPGGVRLAAPIPEFANTMKVFDKLSRRYQKTLRVLAK